MPMPIFASDVVNIWLRLCDDTKVRVGRLLGRDGALRRRTDQSDRILLGEGEIDEKFRVVDFDRGAVSPSPAVLNGSVKCSVSSLALGVVIEPVVDRVVEDVLLPLAVDPGVSEESEVLQRFRR